MSSSWPGRDAGWATRLALDLVPAAQALVDILSLLVVTPVVAFYLLVDWDRMIAKVDSWMPPRHRRDGAQLAREIERRIAGFVRGQALVCLMLGTWYAVGAAPDRAQFRLPDRHDRRRS